jgi:dipeptidyl aminopeptidase/acylaminoacyl peptidase
MQRTRSPLAAALLGLFILGFGFVSGLGYQSLQHAQENGNSSGDPSTPKAPPQPPVVRNLRVSPGGQLLAFTAIYNQSQSAGRFVFDLKTYRWDEKKSPRGWQDSLAQWSRDGHAILFQREKIPRAVEDATAGLHQEAIKIQDGKFARAVPQPVFEGVEPSGEKTIAGFWTPGGQVVAKTRRESKALFVDNNGTAQLVDRSPGTYYQNRATRENNKTIFYVVRDVSLADNTVGLFRIANGKARQIGRVLSDVVWAYLADNARQMLVCRNAENGRDWQWSLYQVSPNALKLEKQNTIPQDVIAVYWSPDYAHVLGAAGKSLWLIDVPSLRVKKLGKQDNWNADDAAWLSDKQSVIVAASGQLWKVSTADGTRREVWRFPDEYWK